MERPCTTQVVFFLLIVLALSPYRNSGSWARELPMKTSTEFIKTSCTATNYPKLCFSSLYSHASKIQTSPELLTETAIDVALSSTASASHTMANLLNNTGLSTNQISAVSDCLEELRDSMDELRSSLGEMGKLRGTNFEVRMSNILTWVSAALTDENTCTDGFSGKMMDGNLKVAVTQQIENIAHLTSIALALVNRFAQLYH